jgi:hypothetical protein
LTYVVLSVAFGAAVVLTSQSRGSQSWLVWAVLAISLTAVSGIVFGYGLARWPEIVASHDLSRRRIVAYTLRVVGAVAGMSIVAAGLSLATQPGVSVVAGGSPRGPLLVSFAGLAALPVLVGLAAVRERARMLDDAAPGESAETVLDLRRLLAGLLAALGSQVTLATLALGAAREFTADQPRAAVLVFGAAWSVVIAVAYVPAAAALQTAARRLCRATIPLVEVEAPDLSTRADERRRLEQALGVDRGPFADMQSGIFIISPLLASAASLFIAA